MKKRIKNVRNLKKSTQFLIVMALALVMILSVGLVINRATGGGILNLISPMSMNNVAKQPHFAGTVTEVYDQAIMVTVDEVEEAYKSSDRIKVSLDVRLKDSMTDFLVGDNVVVYYDGIIAESYPAQVNTVYAIMLTGPDMRINIDDLHALATLRTPHVGDNAAVGKIIAALPRIDREHAQRFFSIGDDADAEDTPYSLTLYYEPHEGEISETNNPVTTPLQSVLLFSLIDNLSEVHYAFRATPSFENLDKDAYTVRQTHSKGDCAAYLGRIGLTWDDFQTDWSGSVDKLYAAVTDFTDKPSRTLTFDDVRSLAKRGDRLLFDDFQKYAGTNISAISDYYIMLYDVEYDFRLTVHSNANSKPDIVRLESIWAADGNGIDIRYEEVDEFLSHWPVFMGVKEDSVTPSGLTITFKNNTGVEQLFGESYTIQRGADTEWVDLDPIIENYGFHDIGYILPAMGSEDMDVDWEWLYGKLPAGEYRIVKDILTVDSPGDYEAFTLYSTFTVAE
ncbi:MAG: immunoglobulin-like domain-containing protein [Fastidiosipilaceae bacterium]|jgi:hypothetical protein